MKKKVFDFDNKFIREIDLDEDFAYFDKLLILRNKDKDRYFILDYRRFSPEPDSYSYYEVEAIVREDK